MRTYVIVSGDFSPGGGMDRANYELAWHLADRMRAQVHLVSHRVVAPLAEHPNVTWHAVPKPLDSYLLSGPLLARAGRAVSKGFAQRGARVVVNGGNCAWGDVNWVHAVHAAWPNRDRHAPRLFRLRSALAKSAARRAERRIVSMAQTVVVNSELARRQVVEHLQVPPERVRVVYLGTDPAEFAPRSEEERAAARRQLGLSLPNTRLVAAFTGALGHDRNKGFDILFDAWRSLSADPAWDVDLVAAGGGAEVALWRARSGAAGLADRVRLLGFTRDVPALLAAADVLVSPTQYDSYGLGVHEALCCGIPALVSYAAGVAERFSPDLAELLIPSPCNEANLVGRLRLWRANRERFQMAARAASDRLRAYTWRHMAEHFVDAMEMPV